MKIDLTADVHLTTYQENPERYHVLEALANHYPAITIWIQPGDDEALSL
jgi:hypothetical protein